ncbi:MAG: hypothetical protein WCK11_03270 [Candidatus Falkowbacteria bacterium]
MWLNFILKISSLIYGLKQELASSNVFKTIRLAVILIFLELFLLIVSLPIYIFVTPEKYSQDKSEVQRYKLKRKFSLAGVAIFLILILVKTFLIGQIFIWGSGGARAVSLVWSFQKSTDYYYDANQLQFIDDKVVFTATTTSTTTTTIEPIDSLMATSVVKWISFDEMANKNGGGNIYYQISDDDGKTWFFWDGMAWSPATITDFNEAVIVNRFIGQFKVDHAKIKFKAFFIGNYPGQVELLGVNIDHDQLVVNDPEGNKQVGSSSNAVFDDFNNDLWLYYEFGNGYWIFGLRNKASVIAIDSNKKCVKYGGALARCSDDDYSLLVSIKKLISNK